MSGLYRSKWEDISRENSKTGFHDAWTQVKKDLKAQCKFEFAVKMDFGPLLDKLQSSKKGLSDADEKKIRAAADTYLKILQAAEDDKKYTKRDIISEAREMLQYWRDML